MKHNFPSALLSIIYIQENVPIWTVHASEFEKLHSSMEPTPQTRSKYFFKSPHLSKNPKSLLKV